MGYIIKKTEEHAGSKKNSYSAFFERLYIADWNVFSTTGGFEGLGFLFFNLGFSISESPLLFILWDDELWMIGVYSDLIMIISLFLDLVFVTDSGAGSSAKN
jgi:hypothetical protein